MQPNDFVPKLELLKKDAQFKALAENVPAFIIQVDKLGNIEYINKILPGFTLESVLGTPVYNFIDPNNHDLYRENISKVLESATSTTFQFQGMGAHGEMRWYETNMSPISTSDIPESVVVLSFDITEKKLAEEKLKKALAEKEVLLKEVHHRVKNNLQILSSIIGLYSSKAQSEGAKEVLDVCKNDIHSLGLVHDCLYQSDDVSSLNLAEYIDRLTSFFKKSMSTYSDVEITTKLSVIDVSLTKAINCGLIINELLTNAYKHAFPSKKGNISIELAKEVNNRLSLVISDDGKGINPDTDYSNSSSFGLEMIQTLLEQLNGSMKVENLNGSKFSISIPA